MAFFSSSPHTTPERVSLLANIFIDHASRIPPTLSYARAQNNNHLLSEAVGLYTAGCALPYHPEALRWRELGWRWFNQGIQSQFSEDGAYMQHSANYHRLALQLALWMRLLVGRCLPGLGSGSATGFHASWLAGARGYSVPCCRT